MDNEYELIVTVVDRGFSEMVMDAAKRKGARGGTVLHARGTGSKEAMQFFNITVQQEKDITLIVAPKAIRNDIMQEIAAVNHMERAQATGITFSLPVDNIVGISKRSDANDIQEPVEPVSQDNKENENAEK